MEHTVNAVGWVEIGARDAAAAQEFYGGLFGWTFEAEASGYRQFSAAGVPTGGVRPVQAGPYAAFCVQVADVADALKRAAELGGKAVSGPVRTDDGLAFGYFADREGAVVGVFSPPA